MTDKNGYEKGQNGNADSKETSWIDEISPVDEFDCQNCNEEIQLIQLKGKYLTIPSAAAPALFGAGGYSVGSSAGIAALGTAWSASWPFAAIGALLGGTAVYVAGDTRDSLECPECESSLDV